MKRLCIAFLLLSFGLAIPVAGATPSALPPDPGPSLELHVPKQLLQWAEDGKNSAPYLLTIARDREVAQSKIRVQLAETRGSRMQVNVPVEATADGLGGGASLSLRQVLGNTIAEVNVGAVAGFREEAFAAAPALGLELRHTVGGDADVASMKYEYQYRLAEATYRTGYRRWLSDLVAAYGAAELAKHDHDIAADRLALVEGKLAGALEREHAGAASPTEVYTATQQVTGAQAAVDASVLTTQSTLDALRHLTGSSSRTVVQPNDWEVVRWHSGPATHDEAAWIEFALLHREDVRLAAEKVRVAEAELANAERRKGLVGEVKAGVTYPEKPTSTQSGVGWYVGAGVTLPLRDTARTEAVVQAELQLAQALADERDLHSRIRSEVALAYGRHEMAVRQHERALEDARQAKHLLEVAQLASDAGTQTQWDVTEAAIRMAEAERAVFSAYFDVLVQRVSLWHIAGRDVAW